MNHDDLKIFSITKKAVGDITNRIISFISVTIEEFYVNSTVHEILEASVISLIFSLTTEEAVI